MPDLADGIDFLSDLCGREECNILHLGTPLFLSDLCGREELFNHPSNR
ncbi:hypothetical protein AO366_1233 [Moraxella catarrhalis]|nr:hypothetical protein AO366_1233 [Moraxella catarrhalis]